MSKASVEVQHKKPSLLPNGDRKTSIFAKSSFCSDDGKMPLKALLSGPPPAKSRAFTPGGQLFLCILGSIISVAICVWSAIFSDDLTWRRVLFSIGAALCVVMFGLLAYTTKRRINHPPEPEPLPDLSQRRSTIGGRCSKKSISAAGIGGDHHPTHVLIVNNKE